MRTVFFAARQGAPGRISPYSISLFCKYGRDRKFLAVIISFCDTAPAPIKRDLKPATF